MSRTEKALIAGSTRSLTIAALLWVLAAPAAAAPADPTLAVLNGAGVEAVLFGSAPAEGASVDGPSALGTVTADCCDGSSVTCEGSSGSFQDADCDAGQRGYCSTPEEGTKYCPSCTSPSCSDGCTGAPSCNDLNGTPCFAGTTQCSGPDGTCATCDCTFGGSWLCPIAA